jgi:hypothetical protein
VETWDGIPTATAEATTPGWVNKAGANKAGANNKAGLANKAGVWVVIPLLALDLAANSEALASLIPLWAADLAVDLAVKILPLVLALAADLAVLPKVVKEASVVNPDNSKSSPSRSIYFFLESLPQYLISN